MSEQSAGSADQTPAGTPTEETKDKQAPNAPGPKPEAK